MVQNWSVRSVFHLNINCSDLKQSIAFYERLGFRKVLESEGFSGPADASYEALGLTGDIEHLGPVVLFLGDDLRQTRLDLMQWRKPSPAAPKASRIPDVGVPRIALWTKNVEGLYAELVDEGVEFLSPPTGPFPDRAIKSVVCARDPDGLVIELIEFLPGGSSLYAKSDAG